MNEELLKLVCLYAYQCIDIDSRELHNYAKEEGLTTKQLRQMVNGLVAQQYLVAGNYDWFGNGRAYRINPARYLECALKLIEHRFKGWMEEYDHVTLHNSPQGKFFIKVLQIALNNVIVSVKKEWVRYGMSDYFWDIYRYPVLHRLVRSVDELSIEHMVKTSVRRQMAMDCPDTQLALLDVVKGWEEEHDKVLNEIRGYLAMNHFLATGEYTQDRYTRQTYNGLMLDCLHQAVRGEYAEALRGFDTILKATNHLRPVKGVFTDTMVSYIHVMTLIHEGSAASMKALKRYEKATDDYNERQVAPARIMAHYFGSGRQQLDPSELIILVDGPTLYALFLHLFLQYSRTDLPAYAARAIEMPQYAFLRHEKARFLALEEEEKARLQERFGTQPLLTSIRFKEAWESTLEALLTDKAVTGEEQADNEAQRTTRMMYLMNRGSIEVREQSRLRNGKWGAGKVISGIRYRSGQLDCMDDRDIAVWNGFSHGAYYELEPELVLPEMVGTDRVYTGYSAPYTPLVITEEKPYLTIERKADHFIVHASYEPKGNKKLYSSPTHFVTQLATAEYKVTPLAGRQRHFFEELLRVRRFPLEAEEALKAFFPKVSNVIEVHSASFAEGNTLETVAGSTVIYLQVTPVTEAFRVRCMVRPLPGGHLTFTPGKGAILVPDEADGRRVQVQRPLKEERQRMQLLTAYFEESGDDTADLHEGSVVLTGEQLLGLVEYIRPLGEGYVMEWQEGKPLRVKKPADPKEWKVGLKSHGGWFDLEGNVVLDDDTMLSMAQLLQLLGQRKGDYIRLNDTDYLQLTDNLRRQLSRLEAAAIAQKGKLHISPLTAGLLADEALNGVFTVKTDKALNDLRARIAESSQLMPKVPSKLKATLRDYQIDGFQWMARLNHWGAGACLADDMGLGKTVQTIAYLIYMAKEGASLVVAPTSVMPNWQKELGRFAPSLRVIVLNEQADRTAALQDAGAQDVVITTYGLLVSENEGLLAKPWNVVCLDEAHTIKNRETKTSAAAMQLQAAHRIILTGTPVQNHLGELWNLFQFINPGLLGSYEQFQQKYILPIEGNHDKVRQQQLNRLVHPFMLRRTKQEVVEELPDKEEIVCPVEMSREEMSVYELIRREAKAMVAQGGAKVNVATLAQITKLRQAACSAALVEKKWTGGSSKVDRLVDLLGELREGGNRALVFSQFTSFFGLVKKALDDAAIPYLYLDGSTPVHQRQKLVEEFQEGDCPFFLISLKAGGLGLNLTGANYIIHLDPWWNPAIEQQATDRAYRIGQTQKVTAYHLVSAHTIEEKILRLHTTKRNLSDALLAGADMSHKLSAKDLLEILG